MADKFLRCEVVGSIANSITVKPYVDGAGIITVCQQDNILFDPDTLRAEGAEEMRQAALNALARTAREKFNLSDEYNHYLAGLMDGELAIKELPTIQPEKAQLSQEDTTSDMISRQAAIDIERNATVDTNPSHFEAHQKFTQFMDDAEISSFGRWQWSNGFNTALTAVGIDLKKLPPAQPEPKEGHWIDKGWNGDWAWQIDGRGNCWRVIECSECGKGVSVESNYCPHCGAHMKGAEHETD